jgi:hypothetical protein
MTIVTYELDNIHASYRRLKYSKLIPCNCATCEASSDQESYIFDELYRFIERKQNLIQCRKSGQMVSVQGLIDDFVIAVDETLRVNSSMLRQFLVERLNDEELRTLCFDLGVDYEILEGGSKVGKARELLTHLDRRFRISDLIETGKRLRPDIPWDDAVR